MKSFLAFLVLLATGTSALATFVVSSPESRRADAAWEKKVREDFDLPALRQFLVRTLADQRHFEGRDLGTLPDTAEWKVDPSQRVLRCGDWRFSRDEKGKGFQFRYNPDGKDRDVVFACERVEKASFRLIAVRSEPATLRLSMADTPRPRQEPQRPARV